MGGHKLVFLDTNGVLNFSKHREEQLRKGKSLAYNKMSLNSTALELVGKLVQSTGAKVVITSSWRRHKDNGQLGNLKRQLKDRAGVEIFDMTPVLGRSIEKEHEIQEWFNRNNSIHVDSFVIIDDELMSSYEQNMVLCNREYGFTSECFNKAYKILSNEQGN